LLKELPEDRKSLLKPVKNHHQKVKVNCQNLQDRKKTAGTCKIIDITALIVTDMIVQKNKGSDYLQI